MKKFGVLVFITAIAIGIVITGFLSAGEAARPFFSFSFGKKTKGSGNIVTEKRDIRDFTGVDVGGVFEVEMTAQKDFLVEIEADDNLVPLIRTEVRNDVLHIEAEKRISSHSGLKIRIAAPEINRIDASGVSRVGLSDAKSEELYLDCSGASKINVSGETTRLYVNVSGASKVGAGGLKSQDANIDASGASNVDTFATGNLQAKASGASRITYSGGPKSVEKRSRGASSIEER